ncbi:MAG: LCP family protein [Anaerolineae bacterium]|nr:MAG: LCP family protein [Anaerolineae bacterium]
MKRPPKWAVWALGGAFVLMAVFSALLVFSTVRGIASTWSGVGLPAIFGSQEDEPAVAGEGTSVLSAAPELVVDTPSWNGVDRINILLLGLDFRDWETGNGPPRTDTMMLVTIDPIAKTAGMLSIPRDLWVEIPGFEHNRINTAYFLGEANRLPGGGPSLAMATVENLLGVNVNYYALLEFSTFERMIDEIGGVEVLVPERMKISPIGEQSLWLEAKPYHLDGAKTLAYARARKTEGGDFDRAQRQQQVIMAVRDKIFQLDSMPTLLAKAPILYQELASGIYTNLSFDEMVGLALLAMKVSPSDVDRGVIAPPDMVLLETQFDGAQVLKPIPDKVRALRDEIFTGTGAIAPTVQDSQATEAAQIESARLAILNGAGIEGLATETAEFLTSQGLNIVEISNADRLDYNKSRIIVHSQNYPYTLRYLTEMLGLTEGQILRPVYPLPDIDLAVVLGWDWAYGDRP